MCKIEQHLHIISEYYNDLVSIQQNGSYQFLEKHNVSSGRKKSVPGWTNKLYGFHQQAKIEYSNWVNSGKSESDNPVKKMNQSQKKFKKIVVNTNVI